MRGYRVGIVGPRSPFGQRVRKLLSEGALPVIELKLFDNGSDEGIALTQFGDDVVVTQPIDPDLFPQLDALLVGADDSDLLNRISIEAGEAGLLTLVEGAIDLGAPVIAPGYLEGVPASGNRLGIVPRVESYLLGTILAAIGKEHGIERAVATVLVPAQALGDPGAEELHQQVLHILNFKAPPTDVLREQLAFNVRQVGSSEAGLARADSVAWEAERVGGIEGVLTVSLVQVPVFHGNSASLWVETKDRADARSIRALFRSKPFEGPKAAKGAKVPSPVSAAGSDAIQIGPIRASVGTSPPGFWLWAVADSTAYDPGATAIEIARAVLR